MAAKATSAPARMLGEFALYGEIAAGGMATIHFGRLLAPNGDARTVAIKRLHPQFAKDAEFRTMFLDEARVAVHVSHPNVVTTIDVVGMENELFLVMEYVPGESLSRLIRLSREKKKIIPPRIAAAIMAHALRGLHAAHEARDAAGRPLQIVHRDISPQNVLVGIDGVARVLDFGVAKAVGRHQQTREGQLKGKIAYMAPEQLNGNVTPRTDIYAAGVTLWEALTAKRLFSADNEAAILGKILSGTVDAPSAHTPPDPSTDDLMKRLDAIVLQALEREPALRFESALAMAEALEQLPLASPTEIGRFTEKLAHDALKRRATVLTAIEKNSTPRSSLPPVESSSEPRTQIAVSHSSSGSGTPPAIVPPSFDSRVHARPKRSMVLLAVGVMALAVLFAGVGAVVAVRSNESAGGVIPPAQATLPPSIVKDQAPPPPDPPKVDVTPAPSSSVPTPNKAGGSKPPTGAGTPSNVKQPTPTKGSGPRRKCEPSYIDDQGHKQYRPECLPSDG